MDTVTSLDFRLLNEFQRDFPLLSRPYDAIAKRLGGTEEEVIAALARHKASGSVSRIGAVFAPRVVGASTLAALAAPADQLERIAELVSSHPEVNHNYQREHAYNLWFVAMAQDEEMLAAALSCIEAETGCVVLRLPLLEEYHIDLGFDLCGDDKLRKVVPALPASNFPAAMTGPERRLLHALQDGLELLPRPFGRLAMRADLAESEVLRQIENWLAHGFVKRFGVVVRHHELGFTANAMCVWDVPDEAVSALGGCLAEESAVTLCYRRARSKPQANWPYNLFCMIHGHSRAEVEAEIAGLCRRHGLAAYPQAVLFSVRRFKQQGARYLHGAAHA